jgi:hypothetical protein
VFLKGIVAILFLGPTYVNVFSIFSITNIHDVSWGSRPDGDSGKEEDAETRKYNNLKDE